MDHTPNNNLAKPGARGTHPAVTELRDAIRGNADLLDAILPPIGAQLPSAGTGDPAGGAWLLADGRLIDKTTYAAFFTAVGHAYNGGVDPGSNKVRIPDKRGRSSIGQSNMGTAQGNATGNGRAQVSRGATGGEVNHQLTVAELASHGHTESGASDIATIDAGATTNVAHAVGATTGTAGSDQAHNTLHPYETDNVIVRVA